MFLGRFSARFGTPVNVNLLSGVMSTVFFVLATKLAGSSAFGVVLSMATLTTVISYALIFPALIKLRNSHGHVHRPYKVPGGHPGRVDRRRHHDRLVGVRSIANMWPYDATVADYGVSRTEFELWVVGVLGTIFIARLHLLLPRERDPTQHGAGAARGSRVGGRGDGVRQRRLMH